MSREPRGLVRCLIGRIAVDEAVLEVLDAQLRWLAAKGQLPQVEGSMRKLFWSESAQRHDSGALDILGAEGVLGSDVAGALVAPDERHLARVGFRPEPPPGPGGGRGLA
jgi:alkylation response protein AidB-like acyl-CoA dehydrogenase